MANEDPSGIPEQVRRNRPFFMVVLAALLIAVAAFLYVLSLDTSDRDIERNLPPAELTAPPAPAAPAADASAPASDPTAEASEATQEQPAPSN